jgi:Uri superfamily endonuclease
MMETEKIVSEIGTSRGAYVLVLQCHQLIKIKIGRLGFISFEPGYYLYTGSALGPGGLSGRISHHFRQKAQKRSRWHIDALTSREAINEIWWSENQHRLECTWAEVLAEVGDRTVPGFGASDCRCPGHLVWLRDAEGVKRAWNVLRERVGPKLHRTKIIKTS